MLECTKKNIFASGKSYRLTNRKHKGEVEREREKVMEEITEQQGAKEIVTESQRVPP